MQLQWKTREFAELSNDELYDLLRLRQQIFVVEQQSIYLDLDNKDKAGTHILALDKGSLVACQRCLPPGVSYRESSMGRIAVHPELRGRELGRELVRRGIDFNRQCWPDVDICISAQAHLQAFYSSLGFQSEGEEYMEDGISHRKMRLPLRTPAET